VSETREPVTVFDREPYGLRSLRRAASDGHAMNLLPGEAADVVAEIERLRTTVACMRASVPPVHPYDYGHEVWAAALRDAVTAERAAVVAFLRGENAAHCRFVSDAVAMRIERGEHRREEKP